MYVRSVQRNYNGDIKLNLKESVRTLWFKHIRLRFAHIYKCPNCNHKYKLTDTQVECPSCCVDAYCRKPWSNTQQHHHICGGKLKKNGQCELCERYTKLCYTYAKIFGDMEEYLNWCLHHFEFKKQDQWIGHYYKDIHAGCDENGPVIRRCHYICIIPCIVINWITRER